MAKLKFCLLFTACVYICSCLQHLLLV
uniref:Uncharacterized protein n=1 Tax=Rhizophora mucronata TaxID=61149 RepID=A0A2P2Q7S4_RHIMU